MRKLSVLALVLALTACGSTTTTAKPDATNPSTSTTSATPSPTIPAEPQTAQAAKKAARMQSDLWSAGDFASKLAVRMCLASAADTACVTTG